VLRQTQIVGLLESAGGWGRVYSLAPSALDLGANEYNRPQPPTVTGLAQAGKQTSRGAAQRHGLLFIEKPRSNYFVLVCFPASPTQTGAAAATGVTGWVLGNRPDILIGIGRFLTGNVPGASKIRTGGAVRVVEL